jgi:hypothetical protein
MHYVADYFAVILRDKIHLFYKIPMIPHSVNQIMLICWPDIREFCDDSWIHEGQFLCLDKQQHRYSKNWIIIQTHRGRAWKK